LASMLCAATVDVGACACALVWTRISTFLMPMEEARACEVCRSWLFLFDAADRWRVMFDEFYWSTPQVTTPRACVRASTGATDCVAHPMTLRVNVRCTLR
jgi:hypothetical protein